MKTKNRLSWAIVCTAAIVLCVIIVYDAFFNFVSFSDDFMSMGSVISYKVTGYEEDARPAHGQLKGDILALEQEISRNIESSQIEQLNKTGTFTVSDEVLEYLKESVKISEMSDGAFDVTIGALSALWNFDKDEETVPADEDIRRALSSVGYEKISFAGNQVTIPAGMQIDLGAVGKGAACDTAIRVMRENGAKSGAVSAGGSVGAFGKAIKVGIRNPGGGAGDSVASIRLKDAFVSTSGDYEKFFYKDGKKYHHLLDTSTGYPIENDLSGVTVICKSGFASDALSTACYALGLEKSKLLLDEYDAMAVFIYKDKTIKVYNEAYDFKMLNDTYEQK